MLFYSEIKNHEFARASGNLYFCISLILAFSVCFPGTSYAQIQQGDYAITATSTLPASSTSDFSPDNLLDGGPDSWSEGVSGSGIGESIRLELRYPDHLKYIMIKNGFGNERYWKSNGRVRKLKVQTGSGREYYFDLEDTFEPQVLGLFEPQVEEQDQSSAEDFPYDSAFTFKILDVYPGERWEDLCITEIGLNQWYYQAFKMSDQYVATCLLTDFLGGVLDAHGNLFLDTDFVGLKMAKINDGYLKRDILSGDGTSGTQDYQVLVDAAGENYFIFHSDLVSEISQESMEGKMDDNGNPIMINNYSWEIVQYDKVYGAFTSLDESSADSLFNITPHEVFSKMSDNEVGRNDIWLYVDTPGRIAAIIKHSPETIIYYDWNGGMLDLFYKN